MTYGKDNFTTTVDGACSHAAGLARYEDRYDIGYADPDRDYEDTHGVCSECGEECDSVFIDEEEVSSCCEAEIIED